MVSWFTFGIAVIVPYARPWVKTKPYLKRWPTAVHLLRRRSLSFIFKYVAISLSLSPMFSPLFIYSSLSLSWLHLPWFSPSSMVFSLFVSLSSRHRGSSLSLGSQLFIKIFFFIKLTLKWPLRPIYIYIYIYRQGHMQWTHELS